MYDNKYRTNITKSDKISKDIIFWSKYQKTSEPEKKQAMNCNEIIIGNEFKVIFMDDRIRRMQINLNMTL